MIKTQFTLPIILDGGLGRELEQIGAPFQQPEWSAQALIETPSFVSQAHQNFIDAGAEVITTNTYSLVPFHIGEQRFNQQGPELITLAAQLARASVTPYPGRLVAGCIPPVLGSYRAELFSLEKAQQLLEPLIVNQQDYVDIWLAETISSIEEAAMIKTRTALTEHPAWISFTIADTVDAEPTLRSGESVCDAVHQIAGGNIAAILFNCSCAEAMEGALLAAKRALSDLGIEDDILLGVYANNFPPISKKHQANASLTILREDLSPTKYSEFAASWLKAGASIIGGCCGVSPEHIKKLAALKKSV